ncbi:MAG: YceH family protein [Planctomycetes bacterium]|nr:YceH family protein [Planctomycetota bacterium]
MHLDRTSRRILGSLVEKRYSTPEQYPLTLNSLVLACNQRSNRDPETSIEEFIVEGCLKQLRIDGWVTVVERDFGRAVRYSERLSDQIGLTKPEAAVMAELMLRGPQTEQELQRRTERMCRIATIDEALAVLQGLAARGLVRHLARETGQRVARWEHLLTPPGEASAGAASGSGRSSPGLHPSGAPAGHVSWVGSKSSGVAAAAGAAHAPGVYQPPTTQPADDPPSPADIDYVPPPGTPDPGWSVTAFPPRNPPPAPAPPATPAAAVPVVTVAAALAPTPTPTSPANELATLRAEIVALKAEVASLRAEVTALRGGSRPG